MALLTLSNEGAPAHFFHLMEAPTMRLPNVKMLLCWPSRMHIYGFIENHTFLEQFVSMGVPAQFSNLGVPAQFSNLGVPAQFSNLGVPAQFSNLGVPAHFCCISLVHVFFIQCFGLYGYIGSLYAWLRYGTNRWRVNPRH